ncbi:hypothetical protein [Nesterenkonia suensis]
MRPATSVNARQKTQALQSLLAAVALSLLGLALVSGDVPLGALTVPQSPFFGAVLLAAGVLFAVASGLRIAHLRSRTRR